MQKTCLRHHLCASSKAHLLPSLAELQAKHAGEELVLDIGQEDYKGDHESELDDIPVYGHAKVCFFESAEQGGGVLNKVLAAAEEEVELGLPHPIR